MAAKIKSPPKTDNGGARAGEEAETLPDSPLLDLSDAAVKKLIRNAKKRGYVTHDQINSVLPSDEVNSEQIEGVLALFNEMGVNLIESEDADPEEDEQREEADEEEEPNGGSQVAEVKRSALAKVEKAPPPDRTDDPVRMYLREMGTVELLSREGEIAIAKRIEAGREAMIAGLCESPLTFQAIIIWRDELNEGKILLRDIIDLEATYAGPDAKGMATPVVIGPDGRPVAAALARGCGHGRDQRRHAAAADHRPRYRPGRRHPVQGGTRRRRAGRGQGRGGIRARFRRGRHGGLALARRHRGRAQAQGAGDLRQGRRRL